MGVRPKGRSFFYGGMEGVTARMKAHLPGSVGQACILSWVGNTGKTKLPPKSDSNRVLVGPLDKGHSLQWTFLTSSF